MAQFLGDLAFILEVLAFGVGVVICHYGRKENAKLVTTAGALVVLLSLLGLCCTGTTYFRYYNQGAFSNAYPASMLLTHGDGMKRNIMMMPKTEPIEETP